MRQRANCGKRRANKQIGSDAAARRPYHTLCNQYDTSAGIWNAGLPTRTSFQSHGLPET